jgi:hypothetical protein
MDKKIVKRLLLVTGIILFSLSLIISHFISITDFVKGLIQGTAIGLLILALLVKAPFHNNNISRKQ